MPEASLKELAVFLNELYRSLVDAGFTEDQAMDLVSYRLPIWPGLDDGGGDA